MVTAVPDILAQIAVSKRRELAASLVERPRLERQAAEQTKARRNFRAALEARSPAIIAEIKQASPSKGVLSTEFHPAAIARHYEIGGAAVLSVLTDKPYFRGTLDDLIEARAAVALPVLRKDFTLDEFHVVEAAAHGADAILLIAALLTESELRRFRELSTHYGMAAIVEVHDEAELERALASEPEIVGVNNRNLRTFEVSLEVSERLAERIPAGVLKVAESGIRSRADIDRLSAVGYRGFLIGEHLMKSADPAQALRELVECL
jgi:indole-3-glycerol phosphate synthase